MRSERNLHGRAFEIPLSPTCRRTRSEWNQCARALATPHRHTRGGRVSDGTRADEPMRHLASARRKGRKANGTRAVGPTLHRAILRGANDEPMDAERRQTVLSVPCNTASPYEGRTLSERNSHDGPRRHDATPKEGKDAVRTKLRGRPARNSAVHEGVDAERIEHARWGLRDTASPHEGENTE